MTCFGFDVAFGFFCCFCQICQENVLILDKNHVLTLHEPYLKQKKHLIFARIWVKWVVNKINIYKMPDNGKKNDIHLLDLKELI